MDRCLCVNAISHLVESPCLMEIPHLLEIPCLTEMPHLMEMPRLVSWKCNASSYGINYFHGKLWHFPCKIPCGSMGVNVCKNEVIIERYCI